jgi:hypothetical protein
MDPFEAVLARELGTFATRRLLADARALRAAGATAEEVHTMLFWRVVAVIDPRDLAARPKTAAPD